MLEKWFHSALDFLSSITYLRRFMKGMWLASTILLALTLKASFHFGGDNFHKLEALKKGLFFLVGNALWYWFFSYWKEYEESKRKAD